jgi:hypothetical protein
MPPTRPHATTNLCRTLLLRTCRVEQCKEPQQHLQKLQELQQQTSSLLAAVAELAKQGACVLQEAPSAAVLSALTVARQLCYKCSSKSAGWRVQHTAAMCLACRPTQGGTKAAASC